MTGFPNYTFPSLTQQQIAAYAQMMQQLAYQQRNLTYGLGQSYSSFYSNPNQQSNTSDQRAKTKLIAAQCAEYSALLRAHYDAPREGIRAGEVIGWRWWNLLNPKDPWVVRYNKEIKEIRLSSITSNYIWEPNVPMQIKDGTKLEEGMGIHAFRSRKEAEANPCGQVLGTVEMWGEIVEHNKGYRSEWAKIKNLVCVCDPKRPDTLRPGNWRYLFKVDPLLTELRKIYGV